MKLTNRLKLNTDQRGFAALIIAIILVIVLSLLTIGFAELMRHSQQDELNRHLSDQAYYAAESGVNDAVRAIQNGFSQQKNQCGPVGNAPGDDSSLVGVNGAQYLTDNYADTTNSAQNSPQWTCLLINPIPQSLAFNPVDTVTPQVFVVQPVTPSDQPTLMNQLDIYWQGTDSATNFRATQYNPASANSAFPAASGSSPLWNSIGMLHFSITPLTTVTRQALVDNTYTAYFYPSRDNSTGRFGTGGFAGGGGNWGQQGDVVNGHCNGGSTPRYCHVRITGIPSILGEQYAVSLRSIYGATNVYIQGSYNGSQINFAGVSTLVDSTGRSQNVLRRLQVWVPDRNSYPLPGFVAESTGGICKQISVMPGSITGCGLVGNNGGGGSPGGDIAGGSNRPPTQGPPNRTYPLSWVRRFHVVQAPANVQYCIWNFGDGTTKRYNGSDCEPFAITVTHPYPHPPDQCTHYNVNMTFYYPGGAYAATPYGTYVPYNGNPPAPSC